MRALMALAAATVALSQAAPPPPVSLTVVNPLAIARPAETIVLGAADLLRALPVKDIREVHVRDGVTGADLLTQAVDLDDDGRFDQVIFQADLSPGETRAFALTAGERRIPRKEEFRAYGRFVRERRDDFAWENDLVAHRMYGAALETWAQEPLTSSAIDVWVKKTPRLVINDWYMVDDYHRDTGEGADFYSAGPTRGCGGSGIWIGGKLHVSANFRQSRVLANGPVRVIFELEYEPWDAGGTRVSEVKRITLDAGHPFNRVESTYRQLPPQARIGIGIRANPGARVSRDEKSGTLGVWEPIQNNAAKNGFMGCAVILDSPDPQGPGPQPVDGNHLALAASSGDRVSYAFGSAWDRGGRIRDGAAWEAYIQAEASRRRAPVRVTLGK
jgi:hypothetical protein